MSKAVLISIRPEWCEKIASGQKTIEVRKTRPKIETPFKCYIYCTKSGKILSRGVEILNGCVIGEFVCDMIVEPDHVQNWVYITEHSSIPGPDLYKYCGEDENGDTKYCFGWHISDLVIYDKPKSLYDFIKPGRKSIDSLDEDLCKYCSDFDYGEKAYYGTPDGPIMCEGASCDKAYQAYLDDEGFTLYRPPQSWCYVEEL